MRLVRCLQDFVDGFRDESLDVAGRDPLFQEDVDHFLIGGGKLMRKAE